MKCYLPPKIYNPLSLHLTLGVLISLNHCDHKQCVVSLRVCYFQISAECPGPPRLGWTQTVCGLALVRGWREPQYSHAVCFWWKTSEQPKAAVLNWSFNLKLHLDRFMVSGRYSQMQRFFCSCVIPAVFVGLRGLCGMSAPPPPKCHSCSEAGCFLSASTPHILKSVSIWWRMLQCGAE